MKLKELIKKMQKLEKEYGDLEVIAYNSSLDLEMPHIYVWEKAKLDAEGNETDDIECIRLSVSHN